MPLAGQIIRASDVRRYLGSNSRATALGAAVTTETTISIDVAFTLTASRRVKAEINALVTLGGTITTATFGYVILRRNNTGSAVAVTDTACRYANPVGTTSYGAITFEEVLAAGTYAYGVTISNGSATNINLTGGTSPIKSATLDVWDMGDS